MGTYATVYFLNVYWISKKYLIYVTLFNMEESILLPVVCMYKLNTFLIVYSFKWFMNIRKAYPIYFTLTGREIKHTGII